MSWAILYRAAKPVLFLIPAALMAYSTGPPPGLTGAPGETNCTQCHTGGVAAPKGSVQISFSGDGSSYAPGVKQTITISFANGTAMGYGFELSARLSKDNTQAGTFTPVTGTRVICSNDELRAAGKSCPTSFPIEYIEHNRPSQSGTWSFDWTPPATDQGSIAFYVAGNAAACDCTSPDTITTSSATLQSGAVVAPPPPPTPPAIDPNGVVTAFSEQSGAVASGWLEIHGSNLIPGTARDWTTSDFANGTPTSLDGVSVTVNGLPAFVRHIGPTEIDVQSPTDPATGPVQVVVTNGTAASGPVNVQKAPILPSIAVPFSTSSTAYALAFLSDGSYGGPTGAVPNVTMRPINGNEAVTFFGAGFGPVATLSSGSDIPAGTIAAEGNALANPVTITIASQPVPPSNILYQGLALGAIGLYQFTIVLPTGLPAGDQPIAFQAGGVDTGQTMSITLVGN
jgi:uncharacterized protein (TIGR03437 family)